MKDCVGLYKYKGFLINFSEYYQEWRLEPTFLGTDDVAIDFAIEYNNDFEGFRTITEAKKYIKENEDNLKRSVYTAFEEYKVKKGV